MSNNNDQGPLSLDLQLDEDRVRRALGLKTSGPAQQRPDTARQRHRFVADGAVPVVMVNRADHDASGLRERLATAEAALESERTAHAATKRALHDLQMAHQALQTRSGHAELAHNEVLAAEREARRLAEEALAAAVQAAAAPVPAPVAVEPPVRARRVKPETSKPKREPKPVRWWTPTYRAK